MPSSHKKGVRGGGGGELGVVAGPKVAFWGAILRLNPAKNHDHAHIIGEKLKG